MVRRGEWEKGDRRERERRRGRKQPFLERMADGRRPSEINLNAIAQHTTHNTRQTDIATKRLNRPFQ